jgi:clumping factor A
MIVVSVVLILVAVALLVLGVAGGSSTLLISSIVASLLAAIALVAGARQAAAMRRSVAPVPEPLPPDVDAGPGPDAPVSEPVRRTWISGGRRGGRRRRAEDAPEPSFADNPPASDEGLASPTDTQPRVANRDDAEAALAADAAYRAEADPGAPFLDVAENVRAAGPDEASRTRAAEPGPDRGVPADDDPDYRRASSVIDAARSENRDENAWHPPPDDLDDEHRAGRPAVPEPPSVSGVAGGSGSRGSSSGTIGGLGASGGSGMADEFDEPDEDDPDDEPLPQAVRPADAVRVARMPAEVLVVDGRPRYHLADCPHLVGRLTEPLPVAEAVELGFSPCGLCRPVDRLVARAAQF